MRIGIRGRGARRIWTPEWIADPYPGYAALREASPLRVAEPMAKDATIVLVLNHGDVLQVLRDPATFSSAGGAPRARRRNGSWTSRIAGLGRQRTQPGTGLKAPVNLISDDPPEHTDLRRRVQPPFAAVQSGGLEAWVERTAVALLDDAAEDDFEAMAGLARPLAAGRLCHMLGLPLEDVPLLVRWARTYFADVGLDHADALRDKDAMTAYLVNTFRTGGTGAGLIQDLRDGDTAGQPLDAAELLQFATLLVVAGHETTSNLLGNALGVLAEVPETWAMVRRGDVAIEDVVEEALRFACPIQLLYRSATDEAVVGGVAIGPGERLAVSFGAANRDPAVFADADAFLPGRPERQHVAFGGGPHYCLGAPLARLEVKVALRVLAERYRTLELARPGTRQVQSSLLFGFRELRLRLRG